MPVVTAMLYLFTAISEFECRRQSVDA